MATSKKVVSSEIMVFPSTRRNYTQKISPRLMSESSISRMTNILTDYSGFIISKQFEEHLPIEFVIHGYYFMTNKISDILDDSSFLSATSVYGVIFIDTRQEAYHELYSLDDSVSGTYEGIAFASNPNDVTAPIALEDKYEKYYLKLFERTNTSSAWNFCSQSLFKFNTSSVNILTVDGGIVE